MQIYFRHVFLKRMAKCYLKIRMSVLRNILVCCTTTTLIFSVSWALLFNWDDATSTHCNNANFLVSVSKSVGMPPASHLWLLNTTISIPLMCLLSFAFYCEHSKLSVDAALSAKKKFVVNFATLFYVVEISGLLWLTIITSKDSQTLHAAGKKINIIYFYFLLCF